MVKKIVRSFRASKKKMLLFGALLGVFTFATPAILTRAFPPTGFQTNLIASGLEGPAGFEIAPDGRIFVLERTGKIKIVKNGEVLAQPFALVNSIASGDRGLIGIDFDPEFGVNNYWVYFYYTGVDLLNHIVRYDASTDVGQQGPYEIFTTQSPSQQLHVGGTIQFGPDGTLYFAVGDNGYPPNAQDLTNPHGKILRINKDGTIPTDNPFYGQPDKLGAIWAYGMRNPWRFQFDEQNGQLIGADVGDFTWEEINRIEKGGNYGWPLKEGNCTVDCAGFTDPIYTYAHNGLSASVTGGPVYRNTMFPSEYRGSYFFADYAQGFIKRATFNQDGSINQIVNFDANAGAVVDMKVAPDGSMYYITYYPGRLYRVSYDSANPAPTAVATSDATRGVNVPFTVNFNGSQSSDPNNDPLMYQWTFGDGGTSTEENPSHTYAAAGAYTAELVVSDGEHTSHATPIVIQVGQPPVVTIAAPVNNSTYRAGQSFTYNAFASDAAGFDLNDAQISTDIIFHHDTHTHPFIDNMIGRAGSFTIPNTGEASANTWFEVATTATDSVGVSTTNSVFIYPEKVTMTYATQPAGLNIQLDGVPHTGPYSVEQVIDFRREVSAPATQVGADGTVYQFKNWSDGGSIRHFMTTPPQSSTITAVYEPVTPFVGEYFNNQNLAGAPAVTRQDPIINFAWGLGEPAAGIQTDNFSVRWTRNQYFAEGRYRFVTATDDGVRLYIDNRLVIDKWQDQGGTAWTYTEYLQAGLHEIRMEYYDNQYDAAARLDWEATTDQTPPAATGWRGEYFNNRTLSGSPVLIRGDQAVDFYWGLNAPAANVPADDFSVRWTKTEVFESGTYQFKLTSDDGIRMYIDGELVLYEWNDHGVTTFTVDKTMVAGPHDIKIEYYEHGFDAVAKFNFVKIAGPPTPQNYTVEYFPNMTLSGVPVATGTEPSVDHDWGQLAPAANVPADNFSARWVKTVPFSAGTYKFTTTADDGVRLYIDDEPIIDKWIDQGATTYTYNKALTEGNHTIRLEYYDNRFDAVIKMFYAKTTEPADAPLPPTGQPWNMEFYGNRNLSGAIVNQDTLYAAALSFNWGMGAPYANLPVDDFSARFTKLVTLAEGTYKFTLSNDDGVRLYIDDIMVFDDWKDQSVLAESVNVALSAGQHTVKLEYYEHGLDAVVKLAYAPTTEAPSGPPIVDPGWSAQYFDNKTLSGTPIYSSTDSSIDNYWGSAAPNASVPADNFSVRWTKTSTYAAGDYTVKATSDDGIRVIVDGVMVIDQWNDHGVATFTAPISLTAGQHTVVVEYYEGTHDAVAKASLTKL